VATTDIEHIHITVAKYITIVGKAVELAGIMPEINKLNITIERRIVISKNKSNQKNDYSYEIYFHLT
jgi:C-terminal processing protease CtpA/Prc